MRRMNVIVLIFVCFCSCVQAGAVSSGFSTAGFYELNSSGREVYNMNIGWRFLKGEQPDATIGSFDDSGWELVSLPHGIELLPEDASGGINYQGKVCYRKKFLLVPGMSGKKLVLHFEGIMGNAEVWLNGKLLKKHFGGFLPLVIDITNGVKWEEENQLVVFADNSDDPLVPPGKPQHLLDFAYFGGIYRDCWLVVHDKLHITDVHKESQKAGGGIFIYYPEVTDQKAQVGVRLHVRNEYSGKRKGIALLILKDKSGNKIASSRSPFHLASGKAVYLESVMTVEHPSLWTPDSPYLYDLEVKLVDNRNTVIDGYIQRIGIRKIEFCGEEGMWLNGRPYPKKLVGVNRHQDFAVIGNALPNSLHWRDVKKLRDAGVNIIRSAHYPQDPAFMDACDELGMFVIVATPGWQFWNKEEIFARRIYSDIRNMVRRDRNHPSVLFWEPVLNETHFPESFALEAKKCVEEEYPYSGGHYVAIDPGSAGSESYPVVYSHPQSVANGKKSVYSVSSTDPDKVYFTREFGDNVDDWNSHNSNSRVHRSWGEIPMLMQAQHYASPKYPYTCLETLYATPGNHLGGTLWHAFDHQRGYHPQPFYGGLMDAFRQPKTSYYLFMSQRSATQNAELPAQTGPMVYIAHEMSPFSPGDVTVYSNCEEVRLTVFENGKKHVYRRLSVSGSMPSPVITFKNAFDFMELKSLSRAGKQKQVYMLAEGLVGGKVVTTFRRSPSRRPAQLVLRLDTDGKELKADGSDIVTLIAEVTDIDGNIKRLSNYSVKFTLEGEGQLLQEMGQQGHFVKMQWGSAPILIRATPVAGTIRIKAEIQGEGANSVAPCYFEFKSVSDEMKHIYKEIPLKTLPGERDDDFSGVEILLLKQENEKLKRKIATYGLKEVEMQQENFDGQR